MLLLWFRQLPWCRDRTPASVPPPSEDYELASFSPKFLHPTKFCLVLFIIFCCQVLLSALSWCSACTSVWRCIPDVSVERDVLHVRLLFCHLVLSENLIFFQERVYSSRWECWMMMEAVLEVRRAPSCSTVFLPASIFTHFLSEKKTKNRNLSLNFTKV